MSPIDETVERMLDSLAEILAGAAAQLRSARADLDDVDPTIDDRERLEDPRAKYAGIRRLESDR